MNQPVHLTAKELAERWRTTPGALATLRWRKEGPTYIKLGKKVLYPVAAVEAFEADGQVVTHQ